MQLKNIHTLQLIVHTFFNSEVSTGLNLHLIDTFSAKRKINTKYFNDNLDASDKLHGNAIFKYIFLTLLFIVSGHSNIMF